MTLPHPENMRRGWPSESQWLFGSEGVERLSVKIIIPDGWFRNVRNPGDMENGDERSASIISARHFAYSLLSCLSCGTFNGTWFDQGRRLYWNPAEVAALHILCGCVIKLVKGFSADRYRASTERARWDETLCKMVMLNCTAGVRAVQRFCSIFNSTGWKGNCSIHGEMRAESQDWRYLFIYLGGYESFSLGT